MIGEGAYSTVFEVARISDGHKFAMKQIEFSGLQEREKINTLAELRILASVRHPNVLTLEECFYEHGTMRYDICLLVSSLNS